MISRTAIEEAARAMRARRAELQHAPLDRIYGELLTAGLSAALAAEGLALVPLNLVKRVTSIARRNEDAPEIHELSAMLKAAGASDADK